MPEENEQTVDALASRLAPPLPFLTSLHMDRLGRTSNQSRNVGSTVVIKRAVQQAIGWDSKTESQKYLFNYRLSSLLAQALCLLPLPMWWLFATFGSDKHTPGWHSYGHTYGALFRRWKYRPVKLLEIGIGGYRGALGGRSLLAWQAYFPFGQVVAADIVPKPELAGTRRRIVQLDQSCVADLSALAVREAPFDIIIDDGSHFSAHQILTFRQLWDSLKDGGVYVVEDVQTSFWPGAVAGVEWDGADIGDPGFSRTCYGYFLELAKYVNHAEFRPTATTDPALLGIARQVKHLAFEHNLIIVRKGSNNEKSSFA
jgi:demethylmacrocin O-methyltransferase